MLPDDPVLKGRLFRAARVLLQWNQAHLAARAGLSASTVNAVENARNSSSTTSAKMMALALEWAGIRFLGIADGLGHGLRYGGSGPCRPADSVVFFRQPPRAASDRRASAAWRGSCENGGSEHGLPDGEGLAVPALLVRRQRRTIDLLRSRGHACSQAVALLAEMERTARLISQSRTLLSMPVPVPDASHRPAIAA
jgi:transcriptional regulator with XRE-family HTH domain